MMGRELVLQTEAHRAGERFGGDEEPAVGGDTKETGP